MEMAKMSEERQSLPQSTAGLTRYFDEDNGGIKVTPEQVVGFASIVVILEILVKLAII